MKTNFLISLVIIFITFAVLPMSTNAQQFKAGNISSVKDEKPKIKLSYDKVSSTLTVVASDHGDNAGLKSFSIPYRGEVHNLNGVSDTVLVVSKVYFSPINYSVKDIGGNSVEGTFSFREKKLPKDKTPNIFVWSVYFIPATLLGEGYIYDFSVNDQEFSGSSLVSPFSMDVFIGTRDKHQYKYRGLHISGVISPSVMDGPDWLVKSYISTGYKFGDFTNSNIFKHEGFSLGYSLNPMLKLCKDNLTISKYMHEYARDDRTKDLLLFSKKSIECGISGEINFSWGEHFELINSIYFGLSSGNEKISFPDGSLFSSRSNVIRHNFYDRISCGTLPYMGVLTYCSELFIEYGRTSFQKQENFFGIGLTIFGFHFGNHKYKPV